MSNGANIFQNTTSPEYHDYPKKAVDYKDTFYVEMNDEEKKKYSKTKKR